MQEKTEWFQSVWLTAIELVVNLRLRIVLYDFNQGTETVPECEIS